MEPEAETSIRKKVFSDGLLNIIEYFILVFCTSAYFQV